MTLVSVPAFIVFVGALATRTYAAYNVTCALDVHGNCDKEFGLIILGPLGPPFTWTDEILSVYCREIVDNIDCKQEYLEKCSNDTAKYFLKETTQDLRDMSVELCNETSDLRAAFRMHNACIRNMSNEFRHCLGRSVLDGIREVEANSENMTLGELRTKSLCRIGVLFTERITPTVEVLCGKDAAIFVREILTRPFENFATPLCVEGKWNNFFNEIERPGNGTKLTGGF